MVKTYYVNYNEQEHGFPVPSSINPQDERLLALHVTYNEVLNALRRGELDFDTSNKLIKLIEGRVRQALTVVRGYYSARIKWGFYPEFVIRIGNKRIQVGSRKAEPLFAQILGNDYAIVLFQLIELRRELLRHRYIAWRHEQEQKRRVVERNAEVTMLLYNLGKYALKLLKRKNDSG